MMTATFHFGERLFRDGGGGVGIAAPLLVRVSGLRTLVLVDLVVRVQHGLEQLQPVQGLVGVRVVGSAIMSFIFGSGFPRNLFFASNLQMIPSQLRIIQGDPSPRGLGLVDLDLGCSTVLLGQHHSCSTA